MHYHTLITFSTGVCQRALLFLSFSHTHMHTHLHYPLLCLCKCEHISLFNTLLLIPSFFIAFQHHQGEFQVFFRTLQSLLCIIRRNHITRHRSLRILVSCSCRLLCRSALESLGCVHRSALVLRQSSGKLCTFPRGIERERRPYQSLSRLSNFSAVIAH